MINTPVFCITCDVDWASDYCIEETVNLLSSYGVKPTLFATHDSDAMRKFKLMDKIEVGIHPNFLPGSTHGSDYCSIIDKMLQMYPNAKTFRSHCFFDNVNITIEMLKRGIHYDSNLCLYLQPNIVPLNLDLGITRFPVFWEDDSHWINADADWNLESYLKDFFAPGLKILNFHPFNVAVNTPDQKYYFKVKKHIQTLSAEIINDVRYEGNGVRTFLIELLELLTKQHERFYTLDEIYQMFPVKDFLVQSDETKGRITEHNDYEYEQYWGMTDREKQEFLRASFEKRDAKDKYATSRDFNARELEINSIKKNISRKGTIFDMGCGNGYTLISLAKVFENWEMVGVDFSKNLIEGAMFLLNETKKELKSIPEFVFGDAIEYVKKIKSNSVGYVITERFIQNMPSVKVQKEVILEVHRILQAGGKFLMCEGSADGFKGLNELRESVGLYRIPETSSDNISAIRIPDKEFESYIENEVGLRLIAKNGFSSFFIISRVLHPLLVAPQRPRFDAKINELARLIQENLPPEAGYGGNVLWVFEKR